MAYQRVEVLTGTERRRNYTPAEKVRMVEEAFRPGVVVTEVARRLGVHESLLYRWRGLMKATGIAVGEPPSFTAVTITPEPTVTELPVVEPRAPLPPPATSATSPAILEVILPSGARLRLEGPVDPALAAAVIGALA
ncbi:transposase [Azospirillum fermentarium]|uniref:IS66-like element accessory protein TnpA n=1 Tax=Azospirillum fermentarium TaxID=1233114 RepID=UPI002227BE98|nr:transposase [Azospirillum fermentarium]MCW2244627.1 transposase [Azospirillum fermentarium]MCW2244748.1 transposase [Azospirillum fermentarium]MCW2245133.1 transposase [Azospirillum fermentarium]MCW2246223.1 transposase [Azospirillum fermentarium]